MFRMLSAAEASAISAGKIEPIAKGEVEYLLTLVESEVRFAAAAGRNKAPLLNEEFKGWDRANATDSQGIMSLVFETLEALGYTLHTEQMLQIGNNSSTCSRVPYPHTVVAWPKTAKATPLSLEATPWCPDDGIAGGFRGAGKTELLTKEAKALLEGRPLSREERTKIADSLGKDLEYVDPVFAQPTSPSPTGFTPSPLPMPGSPVQLIDYLRQKGYKMEGFGCLVEVKHKPTNWDTSRAIAAFVMKLVECHKYGSECFSPSSFLSLGEYPDVDLKYMQGAFAEVGITIAVGQGWAAYRWPVTSWDYTPAAPVAANAGDQK